MQKDRKEGVAKIKKWGFDGIRQNGHFHEVVEVPKPRVVNFSKHFIFRQRGCTYGAVDNGICTAVLGRLTPAWSDRTVMDRRLVKKMTIFFFKTGLLKVPGG